MKWNDNDTKYIFKRLLLYLIITGIIFFTGTKCAKATITTVAKSSGIAYSGNNIIFCASNNCNSTDNKFRGVGTGYIIGNLYSIGHTPNYSILQTRLGIKTDSGNIYYTVCEIGNMTGYTDSNVEFYSTTFKCPVAIGSDAAWYSVIAQMPTTPVNGTLFIGDSLTFVSDGDDAQAIINASNQAVQQQISAGNTNAQAIQSAIQNSIQTEINVISNNAQQAHSDSQAEQQAINNNTQAVNDLNDNIMQDYNVPDDIESDFEFSNWFSQEDSDFIRGILLFPLRIFYLISGALDSNSCIEYSFGRLFGYELKLPCINYKQYVGNTIYTIIDIIFALVIVFGLIRYMISVYDFVFSIGLKGAAVVAAVEVFR